MSDQNTTPGELSDDQLEAAAGGCIMPDDGGILGGGDVKYPGPIICDLPGLPTPPIYVADAS